MIPKSYVDTCLLAAYYCPELLSDKAEKILLSIEEPFISILTEIELISAVGKKLRKKELSRKKAGEIITTFTQHVKEGYYQKIIIKTEHYLGAQNLLNSLQYSLHTLDALHLSIAMTENIPLITVDQNLAKNAKTHTDVMLVQ